MNERGKEGKVRDKGKKVGINEWNKESINEWRNETRKERMNEWMNKRNTGCINEWNNEVKKEGKMKEGRWERCLCGRKKKERRKSEERNWKINKAMKIDEGKEEQRKEGKR